MKKLIVGLTLTAGLAANAQTSTTALPATAQPAPASTPAAAAPATQTLTTEADASLANKFGAIFWVENAMSVKDQNELKDRAAVESLWYMGLKYKATKAASFELVQLATTRSNFEGEPDPNTYNLGKRQVMGDIWVKGNYSSDLRLPGSEPIAFSARYYLPTSQVTRDVLHRNGQLRIDVNPEWILNPQWTFDMINSPRIIYNDQASADGSDTVYRYVGGPAITYNFNDKFNAYYTPYVDIRSANVSRGTLDTAKLNEMYHETGLNIVIGPLTINPALISETTLNDGTSSLATADSRIYSYEKTTYNLNFYANF